MLKVTIDENKDAKVYIKGDALELMADYTSMIELAADSIAEMLSSEDNPVSKDDVILMALEVIAGTDHDAEIKKSMKKSEIHRSTTGKITRLY